MNLATSPSFPVQVCFALPERQTLIDLEGHQGTTVAQTIGASGVQARHPEIDLAVNRVGIFGKLARLDTPLKPYDRVEIYRPLRFDPKVARQRRVAKARAAGSVEGRKWLAKDAR